MLTQFDLSKTFCSTGKCKQPRKPEIILRLQLAFQMGVWWQIILMFLSNFAVSCCRAQHRPFHMATAFSKCHLSLGFAIFLQDLDPFLAYKDYKAFSGYLLRFALNISDEKRQEVKELTDLKNRPKCMSRNLYILVITCANISACIVLSCSFSFLHFFPTSI